MERVTGAAVHYALPDRFGFGIMYTHHKWRIGGGSSRTFAVLYGVGGAIRQVWEGAGHRWVYGGVDYVCGATSERTMEENA